MSIKKTIGTGIAAGALFAFASAPSAFANTGVGLHGNGAFSDTEVDVTNVCSVDVNQDNVTSIDNTVVTGGNTGGTDVSFNTGGSVTVIGGDTSSDVSITNMAGSNLANVGDACGNGSTGVAVNGNGAFSNNDVDITNFDRESYRQANATFYSNQVFTSMMSGGWSSANFNTGTDVVIMSGDNNSTVDIHNQAGSNVLQ